jgi:hypothetical protein
MVEMARSAIVDPEMLDPETELLAVASLAVASADPEFVCASDNLPKTITANTTVENDLIETENRKLRTEN